MRAREISVADLWFVLLALVAYLLAGTVKGITGLGLPTVALGLTTLVLDVRTAVALVILPLLVSNAWQLWRAGDVLGAMRRYAPFALVLVSGVWIVSSYSAVASDRFLYAMTGLAFVLFVVVNLAVRVPPLPARYDLPAQLGLGTVAGILGGLTAVWAPPVAVYLAARQYPREEFVRATGFLIFIGSVPLLGGYLREGLMTGHLLLLSAALVLPALAGFTLGERVARALSPERFRRVTLYVFLLLGLNLLRKAIF